MLPSVDISQLQGQTYTQSEKPEKIEYIHNYIWQKISRFKKKKGNETKTETL